MSEKAPHGATTVRASKGGGGSKWLLGAAAAVVLLGGGYLAWKSFPPSQNDAQTAYNDQSSAGSLDQDQTSTAPAASADGSTASSTAREPRTSTSARRATTRTAPVVPEETIGITPVNATVTDSDEIVVNAPHRPVWSRTPTARRLSGLYPERALERGREGEASLHCTVESTGALNCARVSETPGGFGAAALRVASTYRHAPQLADGSEAIGSPVNLRVVFRMAGSRRG